MTTPTAAHERNLAVRGFRPDPAQAAALRELDALHHRLDAMHGTGPGLLRRVAGAIRGGFPALRRVRTPRVAGLYLWGGVGRGKTYLMDLFFECLPFEARLRLHFHRFMLRVHKDLRRMAGVANPLQRVADGMAEEAAVLCFDEFFVSDIGDAMILGELIGALFDRGVYVYAMGQMGALNDDYGQSVCQNFLAVSYPEFSPRRILDMGCTSGNSTLPYVDAFPDAEVHAIDLGAPVLRYAHARAESLGRAVHFSQQNAECTDFPDGHFDLVVSHIVIHEMSPAALRRALAECRRLLAPGGLMVHADFAGYAGVDPVTQAMIDWDTYYNHEPFWGPMRDMDLVAESVSAGFDDGAVELTSVPTGRMLQTGKQQKTGQLTLLVGRA